ncbi:glycosyltransferase 87 family protein [Micromonospora sp. NPDC093277]|uniref:glycosyltransferase 87 family protein n=1 Tax=Micromonospora sp. NPDC093277 TaxID=3364291 RepID=UPI003814AB73
MKQPRVVALWSGFGAVAMVSSALVMRRPTGERLSDLHIYYGAMRHLGAGHPLYEFVAANGGPFTYPPFAALVLRPIAIVPEPVLRWIWLALTCAAVAAIAAVIGRVLVRDQPERRAGIAAVACGLMISAPAQSNLRFGQVSIFIVLLALIDGAGLTPARYRGVLVGIAAAIKLTPLLFVVHFLISRQYREAGRAIAVFVGCAALGAAVLPADSWTFWTGTIIETSRIGNLASLGNQSVHGMLLRVGIAPASLPVIWAALVAIIAGVALLRARQLVAEGRPGHAAVLVGCATVAASPVSWTHHQVWPVLAAMLLVGTTGPARRVAGAALLVVMTLSLGALLSPVSMRPGIQFLFENARVLGAVAVCMTGFGGLAMTAVTARTSTVVARRWLRAGVAAAAAAAFLAVQPLPAGADPTFKAYALADVGNPRYFFVCRSEAECAAFATDAPVTFGTATEKTKVRVNGVVTSAVTRLEYTSAPGGAPRQIPLLQAYPGPRVFSFRSANMAHGQLVAYGADGQPFATYDEELTAAFHASTGPRPAIT